MVLPNFLIVGNMKCGTSALARSLDGHPDIWMHTKVIYWDGPTIEPHFFDVDPRFAHGRQWYEGFFEGSEGHTIVGEKTPQYANFNPKPDGDTPVDRIYKTLGGDVKLLLMIRDPITRAFSHWNQIQKDPGWGPDLAQVPFFDTVTRLAETNWDAQELLDQGKYIKHVENITKRFRREQLHITVQERLKHTPRREHAKVLEFLDVDRHVVLAPHTENVGDYDPFIEEKARSHLAEYYRPYNEALFEFLGDDIPEWHDR